MLLFENSVCTFAVKHGIMLKKCISYLKNMRCGLYQICTILLFAISVSVSGQVHVTARFDSVWTGYFRRDGGGWTAGDATISVPLPDGRVIWLFGDSYTVPVDTNTNTLPCLFQVRNCYMVQDSVNRAMFKTVLDTTMTGVNQTTFKLRPNDTTLLWPGHGFVRGDTVYLFMERYISATLEYAGCYIAKLTLPSLHQTGIFPVHDTGPGTIYGRAVIADSAAAKLYIYGNKLDWIVWEPVLARCDLSNPLLPWEYYDGSGWSVFPDQAAAISADPVSPGFSVFNKDGKYYLLTQENGYLECGLGRQIYSYESPGPWGPFTGKRLLYTEESTFNGAYLLTYNAQAHPHFIENDELLVSYNVNDRVDTISPYICPSQCKHIWTDRMDADTYRPQFIRVPMGLITGTGPGLNGKEAVSRVSISIVENPVPAGEDFHFIIRTPQNTFGRMRITDFYGRIIHDTYLAIPAGKTDTFFSSPAFNGLYHSELITNDGERHITKIIVQ